MRPFLLAVAAFAVPAVAGAAQPDQSTPVQAPAAQSVTARSAGAVPASRPTKVVARSGRLVTARTAEGRTRSYNCAKPADRKRKVCGG